MDVIFLLLESPPDLVIAVRTRNLEYSGAYNLMSVEYATTEMERIEGSEEFKEIPIEQVDPLLEDIYEWSRKQPHNTRNHVRRVLIHKTADHV